MITKEYEFLAKLILKHYVDKKYDLLLLKDRPDLQSIEVDTGVEVTRGISQQLGKMGDITAKGVINDGLTKVEIEKLRRIGIVKETGISSKGLTHVGVMPIDGDLQRNIQIIAQDIMVKIEKSEKREYTKYSNNYLFIYIESPIIDISNIGSVIKSIDKPLSFDKIYFFLFSNYNLVEFNTKSFSFREIKKCDIYTSVCEEYKETKDQI